MRYQHLLALGALALLSACGTTSLDGPAIDYKSASRATPLEVPPDLSQLPRDSKLTPPPGSNVVRPNNAAVVGSAAVAGSAATPSTGAVAVNTAVNTAHANNVARLERAGTQRWLVVPQTPEKLWPVLKDFWTQAGFALILEDREAGVMETDWAEDRAKLPKDFIARTLGSVTGGLFETGERDRFRTRLERNGDSTEIYVSHRGAIEVFNATKDGTLWQPRDNDPNLEAEFLQRLLVRLGSTETSAKALISQPNPSVPRARLVGTGDSTVVEVDDSPERAWRRVGLALDRSGFTVEERNRSQNSYVVRYLELKKSDKDDPSFLSRLFGAKPKPAPAPERYQISISSSGDNSRVAVSALSNIKANSPNPQTILKLLVEELK